MVKKPYFGIRCFAVFLFLLIFSGCSQPEAPASPVAEPEQIVPLLNVEIEETPVVPTEEIVGEPTVQEQLPAEKISKSAQSIFANAQKVNSYSYLYKDFNNVQGNVRVKGAKMAVQEPAGPNVIYFDTEKKTAEKYCISNSRCGRLWGKIGDLDYEKEYLKTPLDYLAEITEAGDVYEDFIYQRKRAVKIRANIGDIIVEKASGLIMEMSSREGKTYFLDPSYNTVKDEDVVPPSHLVPKG